LWRKARKKERSEEGDKRKKGELEKKKREN
jgi:hypothetical protein